MLCHAGQDMPKAMPVSERASAARSRVSAKASSRLPATISASTPSWIRRAPTRSIAEPPGPTTSSPISGGSPSSSPTSLSAKWRTSWR